MKTKRVKRTTKKMASKHLKHPMYLLSENPGNRVQTFSECLFEFSRDFHPPLKKSSPTIQQVRSGVN